MSASVIAERLQLFSSRVDDAAVHHRSTQTIHAAAGHADAVPGRTTRSTTTPPVLYDLKRSIRLRLGLKK